jgi:hypothetical protein
MKDLPPCCCAPKGAEIAHRMYAAYNRAGDPATAGLNYQGRPCPTWDELPRNIRDKWRFAAIEALQFAIEGDGDGGP